MIVTMDIFSGRPNPSWRLTEQQAKNLASRIESSALFSPETVEGPLGYRGFIVDVTSDDAVPGETPSVFHIGGALAEGAKGPESKFKLLTADAALEIERFLLSTAGDRISEDLAGVAADALQQKAKPPSTAIAESAPAVKEEAAPGAPCQIANTAYNPGFWNVPSVQPHNNCYNYAMNYKSNTFAQPGRISGHPNNIMQCANVSAAAAFDGCGPTCTTKVKLVALVVWPGHDYHWYRRQAEGFWGHKPGQTAARNTDNSGRLINGTTLTPANCNRGNYTNFCGYRFSPWGMQVR